MTPAHITINDVARAAGVSKSLVSLTLNDRPGVAPEQRRRTPMLRATPIQAARFCPPSIGKPSFSRAL